VRNLDEINRLLAETERELAKLNARRAELLMQMSVLQQERASFLHVQETPLQAGGSPSVTNPSSQEAKIALFRGLFRGREDVYPKRFQSLKTGKTGYQPVCRNEWVEKPEMREFLPVTDDVVRNHLLGMDPQDRSGCDFTIGVYPMLLDETCWFLATDFDKASWQEDARAFLETCRLFDVPAALERSRSGHGGHVWIFFSEPVPAARARKIGAFFLTQTTERRPEIGLDSYDRFSPARIHSPKGALAI